MTAATIERPGAAQRLPVSAEFVASAGSATVAMGERLGLYEAFDRLGTLTDVELAAVTCLPIWLTQGWLAAQVSGGYLEFDERTGAYRPWCLLPRKA